MAWNLNSCLTGIKEKSRCPGNWCKKMREQKEPIKYFLGSRERFRVDYIELWEYLRNNINRSSEIKN
jgi:hypothetical protein